MKNVWALMLFKLLCASSMGQEALGKWSPPVKWQDSGGTSIFSIHMSLLPNKKLLVWNRSRGEEMNDPPHFQMLIGGYPDYMGLAIRYGYGRELFCAGHTFLEDGTLYIGGGHGGADEFGIKDTTLYFFDELNPWLRVEDMAAERWYPTCVLLPNRRVMTHMGSVEPGEKNTYPSLWVKRPAGQADYGYLVTLPKHYSEVTYPHMWVDPRDGNLLYTASGIAGEDLGAVLSSKYDLVTSTWANTLAVPKGVTNVRRNYCSSVMVNGLIVRSGGSRDPNIYEAEKTTIYCDLNDASPTWVNGPDMNLGRKNHTLVALPDGQVLAMGGNLKGNVDKGEIYETLRSAPEMWDPFQPNEPWTLYAKPPLGARIPRGYHSTSLLLPDARVIIAGGEPESPGDDQDPQRTMQTFSPPYGGTNNWESLRPTINFSPTTIRYDENFTVNVGHANAGRRVKKVTLISIGSTTHAFNENQRVVFLEKTSAGGGNWTVTPPANANIAPPGYYMLFVVDESSTDMSGMGIPSEATIVKLVDYSMILADTGGLTLTTGTYHGLAAVEQTYIGDQSYLGSYIHARPITNIAELEVVGTAHTKATGNVRIQAECKASVRGAELQMYLWNWSTSDWDQIGPTFSLGDANFESKFEAISSGAGGISPYIKNPEQTIKAKLRWSTPDERPAAYYLDVVELGIRQ